MKKLLIIALPIVILFGLLTQFDYRHNYRLDAAIAAKRDTGRIMTLKLKTGHIRMYYVDKDTGYFKEAPECPMCSLQKQREKTEDSIRKIEELKAKRRLLDSIKRTEIPDSI